MGEYTVLIVSVIAIVLVVAIGTVINRSQHKTEAERTRLAELARKRAAAAGKVKKVLWRDDFSIEQRVIDKEHNILFGLVNEFNDGIPKYRHPDEIVSILTFLTRCCQKHFQSEEKLQKILGCSFYEDHKKEHADLIGKLDEFKQKAMQADIDNLTDVAVEIGSYLEKWLTRHEIEHDLPIKPYLDLKLEQAKSVKKPTERMEAAS